MVVLLARTWARSLTTVAWSAPLAGVGAYAVGFVLADHCDLPPGQTTVVVLGVAVAGAHGVRRLVGGWRRVVPR